jgi:Tfp pilus assembly protein FimT
VNGPDTPEQRRARGFSVFELLVVLAIVIVMVALTIPSLVMSQRTYATDDAAGQAVDFLRSAYERALTQRQIMRVKIDRGSGTIQLVDENGPGEEDDDVVRTEPLAALGTVTIGKPSGVPKPPAPYDFEAASFATNSWEIRFRSDGLAMNSTGRPQSAALYFYLPQPGNATAVDTPGLVRAITIFGPTAAVKLWGYDGAKFVKR